MQPISRQGTNLEENLWVICRECNRAKGNMTLYEFAVKKGWRQIATLRRGADDSKDGAARD